MTNAITIKDENTGEEKTIHTAKTIEEVVQNLMGKRKKYLHCPKCDRHPNDIKVEAKCVTWLEWNERSGDYREQKTTILPLTEDHYCGECGELVVEDL